MGLKEVANEKYQQGQPDYRPSLSKVKAANPDLVFLVSYDADAILLMRQAKEIGLASKAFLGAGAQAIQRLSLPSRRRYPTLLSLPLNGRMMSTGQVSLILAVATRRNLAKNHRIMQHVLMRQSGLWQKPLQSQKIPLHSVQHSRPEAGTMLRSNLLGDALVKAGLVSDTSALGIFLKENLAHAHVLVYGIITVLCILYLPKGILGLFRRTK